MLFFDVLDRRPGYHYYIFINDDTILKYNEYTPAKITTISPFRAVEEWLLDYDPTVGVLNYKVHGASTLIKKRRVLKLKLFFSNDIKISVFFKLRSV